MRPVQFAGVRPTAGRIDHIVLIYRTRESQDSARQTFSSLLAIDDWVDLGEVLGQVHVVVSFASGLELICPTQPNPHFDSHLERQGEGFFNLSFGVADLDQAVARLTAQGHAFQRHPPSPAVAFETFEIARQASIGRVGGISVNIGEFKLKTPEPVSDRPTAGRIDHIVMTYGTRESQEVARRQLGVLLGIDDWLDLGEVFDQFHVIVSFGSGIELICPTKPDPVLAHHLATKGEGFHSLVFGVADLDQAVAVFVAQGFAPRLLPRPPEAVFDTFAMVREAAIGDVAGLNLTLGEFRLKRDVELYS